MPTIDEMERRFVRPLTEKEKRETEELINKFDKLMEKLEIKKRKQNESC